MITVFPYLIAQNLLELFGVDFQRIYNERGGMQREQLKVISKYKILTGAKSNAYKTIRRLDKSKNKQSIDFAANLKNTMAGTISNEVMDSLANSKKADEIMVKWLPSSATEHRVNHALQYGKTMSIKKARKLGLGVDYGCQCGMQIISGDKHIQNELKKINRGK